MKGKAKYTCLQKSPFVPRTVEATVEPQSLILILYYLLFWYILWSFFKGIISLETLHLQERASDLMEPYHWGGISLESHFPKSQLKVTSTLMPTVTPLFLFRLPLFFLQLISLFSVIPLLYLPL